MDSRYDHSRPLDVLNGLNDGLESQIRDMNNSKTGAPNGSFQGIVVWKALNRLRYSDLIAVKARGSAKHHVGLS